MTSKLSLKKKKKKIETPNGLDDVSMDGPDSLLFINCGDIFAESIFIYLFISFYRQLLCYTRTATDIPAASRASLKKSIKRKKGSAGRMVF